MNEPQAADTWLYATLAADATLRNLVGNRIYGSVVPQGTPYPFVIYQHQAGQVRNAVGASERLWARPLYLVKAVAEGGGYGVVDSIADAIDVVLTGKSGNLLLGGITYVLFVAGLESHVRYVEIAGGRRFAHAGGLYRLFVEGVE